MNKNNRKLIMFLAFFSLGVGSLVGCSKTNNFVDQNNQEIPNKDEEISKETDFKPITGVVKGSEDKKNKDPKDIYDGEGTLILPFDEAYPEYMNQAFYDQNTILVKSENKDILGIYDKLKDKGVVDFHYVSKVNNYISWYQLDLENVKSSDVINTFRHSNTKGMVFDLNYCLDGSSLYVTENVVTEPTTTPVVPDATIDDCNIPNAENNVHFKDQYYYKDFGFKEGYEALKNGGYPAPGTGVTVAVIDTGVKINHKDLRGNIWKNQLEIANNNLDDDHNGYVDDVNGWNFVNNNKDPNDDNGHGTHVAGIIAAQNNNIGTVGIAYNAKIMPIKAGDSRGNFRSSDIAKAIEYAYMNGADIINMSFGGNYISQAEKDALKAASETSCLVAAAGNDGNVNEHYKGMDDDIEILPSYPANLPFVVGVMSCDKDKKESVFTNFDGKKNTLNEYEVYAPGLEVYSTVPDDDDDDDDEDDEDDYEVLSGTSMSAPIVSGMLAVLRTKLSDRETYSASYLQTQIIQTANETVTCDNDDHEHHNLPKAVNLFSALDIEIRKPQVHLIDYKTYDLDTYSKNNNKDGNLDAGETIYLAAVLKNYWDKAEGVTIGFELNNALGDASSYVTLENKTLNFEGIGTNIIKDHLLLDAENSNFIGCDTNNSLKIVLNDKIPNKYKLSLNYIIKYKSGTSGNLTEYVSEEGTIELTINSGKKLPKVIDKDFTINEDELYLCSKETFVEQNAKLIMKPGSTLIFDDEEPGAYGGSATHGVINLRGEILTQGTFEKPVTIKGLAYQRPTFNCIESAKINLDYTDLDSVSTNDTNIHAAQKGVINHCKLNKCYMYQRFELVEFSEIINSIVVSDKAISNKGYVQADISMFNITDVGTEVCITKADEYSEAYGWENGKYYFSNKFDEDCTVSKMPSLINLIKNSNYSYDFYYLIDEPTQSLDSLVYGLVDKVQLIIKNKVVYLLDGTVYNYEAFKNSQNPGEVTLYNNIIKSLDYEGFVDIIPNFVVDQEYGMAYSDGTVDHIEKSIDFTLFSGYAASEYECHFFEHYLNNINSYNVALSPNGLIYSTFETEIDDDHKQLVFDNVAYVGTNDQNILDSITKDGIDDPHRPIIGFCDGSEKELENTWPFVTKCEILNSANQHADVIGNELMTIKLHFNRDMDPTVLPNVNFGPDSGEGVRYDYKVKGTFIDARTWVGTYNINQFIDNGRHRISIDGGRAADDHFLTLTEAPGRFSFEVNVTSALAQSIKGVSTDQGINLSWTQDDYGEETIMGYNIYRGTSKDGMFEKLNVKPISKTKRTYLDMDVQPGHTYWYTFTMVLSDFTETKPAGKINVRAKDNMAPNIYHEGIHQAYTNNPLSINCTVSDNIAVKEVKIFYRTIGETVFKEKVMNKVNNLYNIVIQSSELTVAGLEYYIEAIDTDNNVTRSHDALNPFQVIIKENSVLNHMGDVDNDGMITVIDAQMILKHIYNEIVLTPDQFIRADLNKDKILSTSEALRILQYINGNVPNLEMN